MADGEAEVCGDNESRGPTAVMAKPGVRGDEKGVMEAEDPVRCRVSPTAYGGSDVGHGAELLTEFSESLEAAGEAVQDALGLTSEREGIPGDDGCLSDESLCSRGESGLRGLAKAVCCRVESGSRASAGS